MIISIPSDIYLKSKTRVTSYEFRYTCYEFKSTSVMASVTDVKFLTV